MRCRFCGAATREVSSHTELDGFVLSRRRQCVDHAEHVFNTMEIDDSIAGTVGKFALAPCRRTKFATQVRNHVRDLKIYEAVKSGLSHAHVGRAFGLSPSFVGITVYRIKLGREHGRHYSTDEAKAYQAAIRDEHAAAAGRARLEVGAGDMHGVPAHVDSGFATAD